MPQAASLTLPVGSIQHGRNARVAKDPDRDKELVASIRAHGVLQAIRVRPVTSVGSPVYEIVAGHRRFEAAKKAGLKDIPVTIATPSDSEAFVQSLVENLQRRDLDPLDEARAFQAIIDEQSLTQDALSRLVGRVPSEISKALDLLDLDPMVAQALSAGEISVGSARVIARLEPGSQAEMAQAVVAGRMTVREVEAKSAEMKSAADAKEARNAAIQELVPKWDALLKAADIGKTWPILVYENDLVVPLRELGWKATRPVDMETDSPSPQFDCDCKAVWLSMNEQLVLTACVVREHARAAEDARKVKAATLSGNREKLLAKARRAVVKDLRTDDGLNIDGLRVTLYAYIISTTSTFDPSRKTFVERNGGEWPATGEEQYLGATIWEAICGLSPKDLITELLERVAARVIPNVYGGSSYVVAEHAAVRQYLVDQFGLDKEIVWGGHEPWSPRLPSEAPQFPDEAEIRSSIAKPDIRAPRKEPPTYDERYDAPIAAKRINKAGPSLEDPVQLLDGTFTRVVAIRYPPPAQGPATIQTRAPDGTRAEFPLSDAVPDKGFWRQVAVSPEVDRERAAERVALNRAARVADAMAATPAEVAEMPAEVVPSVDDLLASGALVKGSAIEPPVAVATGVAESAVADGDPYPDPLNRPEEYDMPDVGSPASAEASVDLLALAADAPAPSPSNAAAEPFAGQTLVVTGVIEGMDRSEVEQAVNRAGGRAASAVTVSTTLLVIGEKPGAVKVQRAKDLGVRTISGDQFRRILRGEAAL